jgi:hypothetical protein
MENLDLIDVGIDDSNFVTEFDDTIEYAISDYVSILYNKSVKKFTIEWLDQETFDEYIIDVNEPFEDMEIDGVLICKSDFEEFKELVLKSS